MRIDKDFIVATLDDSDSINDKQKASQYKDLTEFFIRYRYSDTILQGTTIDDILEQASFYNKKYCLIQSIGHFIQEPEFYDLLTHWVKSTNFFVTGHIIDRDTNNSINPKGGEYYGFHKQCLLVNLEYYKKFNKPLFGENKNQIEKVTRCERHTKDIHDDYTPILLNPTDGKMFRRPTLPGWNFINISLANDLPVYNFHNKLRFCKQYIYPSKKSGNLEWFDKVVDKATKSVFVWNTETYDDIVPIKKQKIDKFYFVASSFKPNFILDTLGFSDTTEVIYYDYCFDSLYFKNLLLKNWDGEDYIGFLRWAKQNYNFRFQNEHKNHDDLWKKEVAWWGSEKKIKDHWLEYKKLKHDYVHVDICNDPSKVTNKISAVNSFIWWSNVFYTVNAHYTKGLQGVKTCYTKWLFELYKQNPHIMIAGKDYLNNNISGNILKEYIDAHRKD